jgi:hypothetical protein
MFGRMSFDLTGLDDEAAAQLLSDLLKQLAGEREEAQRAERRAEGIRKVIDGLVEMFPALWEMLPEDLDGDEETRPRGSEAVRRVLLENRGDWFTVGGVVGLLGQQGWGPTSKSPANAVRTALERLVERDDIEKTRSTKGAVIYRLPEPDSEEPF